MIIKSVPCAIEYVDSLRKTRLLIIMRQGLSLGNALMEKRRKIFHSLNTPELACLCAFVSVRACASARAWPRVASANCKFTWAVQYSGQILGFT